MIIELAPQDIAKSPSNPRKRGLLDGIDDLTESIRAKGLLQPVVVRTKGKGHELVFGHRRREAAIRAELATIPCIVREFSDDEVLEVQLMENLEREDVHPLDEAEGFAELVKRGRTVQQIAEKVGRPAAFVAQRMKLLDLVEVARESLDNGQISLAVAMVLARVPVSLQEEALGDMVDLRDWKTGAGCTVQEAMKIVKEHFVLRLTLAKFPTDDPNLVKAAGPCTTCPKRSGNQGVLFADFEDDDLCLDPACHRKKLDAQWKLVEKKLPEKYSAVLADKDVLSALANTYSGAHVRLDGKTNVAGRYDVDVKKTFGKDLPPLLLGRDQRTGELIEFVRRTNLEKAVKAKQAKAADKNGTGSESSGDADEKWRAQQRRDAQKKKALDRAIQLAIGAVVEHAPSKTKPEQALRIIVMSLAKKAWSDTQKAVLDRRGIDPGSKKYGSVESAIVELAQNLPAIDLPGLGLELAVNIARPSAYHAMHKGGRRDDLEDGELDIWGQLLDAAGVDLKALEKAELEALKTKEKEKAAKAKARAAKAPAAAAPAKASKAKAKSGTCRECGCTDDEACEDGCVWVDDEHTLCSSCVPATAKKPTKKPAKIKPAKRAGKAGAA